VSSSFEDQIKKAKEKEAYLSFEFYHILKNTVSSGLMYEGSRTEFKEVIPELQIGEERADLVVFASKYGRSLEPFLVIETKVRAYDRPGPSMANGVKKALHYATRLNATLAPFFAVHNGWELMVFRNTPPYLVGAYGSIKDENQARNLLVGLGEFSYTNKKELLARLSKHPDQDFLIRRVMPSVAKALAKESSELEALLKSWRESL